MNKLTDDKLDTVLGMLASKTSLDETTVSEISASQQLWWSVQRSIAAQKELSHSPWPPSITWRRWLAFGGVPVMAGLLVLVGVYLMTSNTVSPDLIAEVNKDQAPVGLLPVAIPPSAIENDVSRLVKVSSKSEVDPRQRILVRRSNAEVPKPTAVKKSSVSQPEEIKSEFIALTYSRNPESGQIVRVRVPSSMMVNLGLVDSVAKPTSLVDAEVVVGDDGQTHAIRFIRQ